MCPLFYTHNIKLNQIKAKIKVFVQELNAEIRIFSFSSDIENYLKNTKDYRVERDDYKFIKCTLVLLEAQQLSNVISIHSNQGCL